MHFTSAISVIAAYALFATANGAVIHDNLSGVQCDVSGVLDFMKTHLYPTSQLPWLALRPLTLRSLKLFMPGM